MSKENKPDRWSAGAQMVYTIGIIKSAKSSKENLFSGAQMVFTIGIIQWCKLNKFNSIKLSPKVPNLLKEQKNK